MTSAEIMATDKNDDGPVIELAEVKDLSDPNAIVEVIKRVCFKVCFDLVLIF